MESTVTSPIIILTRSQLNENVGAVARAMLNFNIHELRLVAPLVDHLCTHALHNSAGADDILHNATVYPCLASATADLTMVIGTIAEPRDVVCKYETPRHFFENPPTGKYGIVFGPERTGLTHDDMVYCHKMITIPTNIGFTSLNIAQAASLICYEWFQTQTQQAPSLVHYGATAPATQEHRRFLYQKIEDTLENANYWRVPSKKAIMWRNLQGFLNRIDFTHQDIQTLLGIMDTLKKSGK